MNQKGLTLIEILTVISIIGIIASFVVYNFGSSQDEKRKLEILNFSEGLEGRNIGSLVSKWTFDGPTQIGQIATNYDVEDGRGYNDGEVSGHAPMVAGGGDCIMGKCLYFDGASSYVEVGDFLPYSLRGEAFTISFWAKPTSFDSPNLEGMISAQWLDTNAGYAVLVDTSSPAVNGGVTDGVAFYIGTGAGTWEGGSQGTTSTALTLNEWTHITAVAEANSTYSIYFDGELITNWTAGTSVFYDDNCRFTIGSGFPSSSGTRYFEGYIDEVKFFNKALTIAEINSDYKLGKK